MAIVTPGLRAPVHTSHNRAVSKGFLAAFDDPNLRLVFQYNPPEIKEEKTVEWAGINVPGSDDSLANFGSGRSLKVSFSLFFNDFGESYTKGGTDTRVKTPQNGQWRVEEALAFLHSFTETRQTTDTYAGLSPRLLLFWFGDAQFGTGAQYGTSSAGPAMICRLTKLGTRRGFFDPSLLTTRRATVDLELTRHALFPR